MALTRRRLMDLLSYDLETGEFRWRDNPRKSVTWNRRWAGRLAGVMGAGEHRGIRIDNKLYRTDQLAFLYVLNKLPPTQAILHTSGRNDDDRWDHLALMPLGKLATLRPAKLDVSEAMHPRRKKRDDKGQ